MAKKSYSHPKETPVKVEEPAVAYRRKGIVDALNEHSVPEGYITSEYFWKEADKRIISVCKQYGIL